jgi:NADH-quinone oxidoreductase subunit M
MSGLALPGLASFVSEFLVVVGTYPTQPVAAVLGTTGIILAALYMLLMYKRIMTGPKPESLALDASVVDEGWRKRSGGTLVPDLTGREKLVAAPLIAAVLVLGFFPNLALDVINPAVNTSISHVGTADTSPPAAGAAAEGSSK